MSILPVSNIGPVPEIPDARSAARRSAPSVPDSGTPPDAEPARASNVSSLSEVPKDEVEVQRDSQNNGEIVVRYMDHAGNLILQMPSEQVLNVTRSIDEDLERERQSRAKLQEAVEGSQGR
jgi:hypothetical protein